MSGTKTVRQQARKQARQARAKVRQEQAQRERRLAKWGDQVAVTLAERDATVTCFQQRAGEALGAMITEERLTATEAVGWCGVEGLTARDIRRMVRQASASAKHRAGTPQENGRDQVPGQEPCDEHGENVVE